MKDHCGPCPTDTDCVRMQFISRVLSSSLRHDPSSTRENHATWTKIRLGTVLNISPGLILMLIVFGKYEEGKCKDHLSPTVLIVNISARANNTRVRVISFEEERAMGIFQIVNR